MDIATARAFFMWCTIINGAFLTLFGLFYICAEDWMYRKHSKWFPISKDTWRVAIYCGIGLYKIAFILFNVAPWIALIIMGNI